MELLADPQAWLAFATLVALELVLGIDNIIFISILADKLPAARRDAIRRLGLLLAMLMRIALLAVLAWLVGLTEPFFHVLRHPISGRDLILIAGGLFLLYKSTTEIHQLLEGGEGEAVGAVTPIGRSRERGSVEEQRHARIAFAHGSLVGLARADAAQVSEDMRVGP